MYEHLQISLGLSYLLCVEARWWPWRVQPSLVTGTSKQIRQRCRCRISFTALRKPWEWPQWPLLGKQTENAEGEGKVALHPASNCNYHHCVLLEGGGREQSLALWRAGSGALPWNPCSAEPHPTARPVSVCWATAAIVAALDQMAGSFYHSSLNLGARSQDSTFKERPDTQHRLLCWSPVPDHSRWSSSLSITWRVSIYARTARPVLAYLEICVPARTRLLCYILCCFAFITAAVL